MQGLDGLDDIVQEFLVESHENLDQLDSDLVALESTPGSRDLLSSVFRTIHTIKGTSGFLAFHALERVTHAGENLLAELRDGRRRMDARTTDALLRMVDTVREILRTIEATGAEGDLEVSPVVEQIEALLAAEDAPQAVAAVPEPTLPEPTVPAQPASESTVSERTESESAVPEPALTQPALTEPAASAPAEAAPAAEADGAAPSPPRRGRIQRLARTRPAAAPDAPDAAPDAPAAPAPAAATAPDAAAHPTPDVERPAAPALAHDGVRPDLLTEVPHPRTQTPAPTPPPAPAEPSTDAATTRTAAEASVRVDVDVLDALMRQVGELVLARNALTRLVDRAADAELRRATQRLSLIASELQEGVMRTRMQPIEQVWSKVPRMVRDLSAACDRQVRLVMHGGDTELDRSLLEALRDPLTHLVRNAVDHGIEHPDTRIAAGKQSVGVLTLRAYHAGGQVVVEVIDDGAGIDPERIAAKAVERGLRTQRQISTMAQSDILQLLFLPGFSTAEQVTHVSGRGVGMDVVRTRVEAIGGTVDVESEVGRGTTWRLRVPLTLAIMPALTVECDGQLYAIPQVSLLELVALDGSGAGSVEQVRTAAVYRLRGELLALVDLREVLHSPPPQEGRRVIAVLQADGQRFGLLVDRVVNSEEIVVKSLPSRLKPIGLYAGATLLSDGRVALILDVQAVGRRSMRGAHERLGAQADRAGRPAGTSRRPRKVDKLLVAAVGADRTVALPLDAVTRLETLPASSVEHTGGREVLQYRGTITPVLRLEDALGAEPAPVGESLSVVVSTRGERSVAIVVREILDVVEDDPDQHSDVGGAGLLGSTVVRGRVTDRVDLRGLVEGVCPGFFDEPAAPDGTSDDEELPFDLDDVAALASLAGLVPAGSGAALVPGTAAGPGAAAPVPTPVAVNGAAHLGGAR